jgi:hypothetical protein
MPLADRKVPCRLQGADRPALFENPGTDLSLPSTYAPQGRIDLVRQGVRRNGVFFLGRGLAEKIVLRVKGVDPVRQSQAVGLEDHPEKGNKPLR